MSIFTVAMLQIAPCDADVAANAAKGEAACREARALGADLALFPEMWSIGYAQCPSDAAGRAAWQARAEPADGPFVGRFGALARELDLAIAVTYLERRGEGFYNSVTVLDRRGTPAFTYAKVHTCEFDWERELTPGPGFVAADVETRAGSMRLGAMICYDREFPESARVLMLSGAEIILVPNACEMDMHRLPQIATRAYENMTGIVVANYPGQPCLGRSVAYDAVAFSSVNGDDGEPIETLIVEAGEAEQVVLARFDLERLREYRGREAWGDAYRKPRTYGPIVARDAVPPFVRDDARR
ncbi:MAG TPA: carbon-nitrogen hydrolase family protein [Dehalococcoidia bacterium]|nr:carbon-nitrogen hydrolase family protein [Dehalococcoidia bacterium]